MVLPWHNPIILAEQAATLDLMSDGRLSRANTLIGTADEIADKLEALRSVGVTYVILNCGGSRQALQRFAGEIMPAFKGEHARTAGAVAPLSGLL